MSADLLRRAAAELRERAANTTTGTWKLWGMAVLADQDGTSNVDTAVEVAQSFQRVDGKPRTFDANYMCLMQPSAGLLVADWLDDFADSALAWTDRPNFRPEQVNQDAPALVLARQILRESA